MNITFNLKDKSKKETAIRVVITHKGKVYRKNTGVTTSPNAWARHKTGNTKKDAELKRILLQLTERLDEMSTDDTIKRVLEEVVTNRKNAKADNPDSFWNTFKKRCGKGTQTEIKNEGIYNSLIRMMGRDDSWEDITMKWYYTLIDKMNEREMSKGYQQTVLGQVKAVMRLGFKLKLHNNRDFEFFTRPTEFVAEKVYLTEDEVNLLWNFKSDNANDIAVRDLFLIGVYSASRYSDYSRITSKNIKDGMIRFTQEKTHNTVVIPLSPRVKEILDRNNGAVPLLSHTGFNKIIKRVCRQVGIDSEVLVHEDKGTRIEERTCKKWELVTAHTARRTGATLLYKSGVPIRQCMFITGHTTESSFLRYIRITKEENATMLQDNPFFK